MAGRAQVWIFFDVEMNRPGLFPPRIVRQRGEHDCGVAACAMITGQSYEQILSEYPHGKLTIAQLGLCLARRGFVGVYLDQAPGCLADVQTKVPEWMRYPGDVKDWPPRPWAPMHLVIAGMPVCKCADGATGLMRHCIVLLADGTVLDPARDEPQRYENYPHVWSIFAVWRQVARIVAG